MKIPALAVASALIVFMVLAVTWDMQRTAKSPQQTPGPSPTVAVRVSPRGNNAIGNGTPVAPLLTVQAALDRAQPGETVRLQPGTYHERVVSRRDGRPDAPITLTADGPVILVSPDGDGRLFELKHDYYRIEGLTFTDADTLLYLEGASHNEIRNNTFHHALGECIRAKYFSNDNIFEDNTIHDCGREDYVLGGDGKNGEGIYLGTAPEQLYKNPDQRPDTTSGNIIRRNTITTNANECVDIKESATANIIEHNDCTGQLDEESGGISIRGSGNTIQFNHVYGNRGAGVRLGGDEESQGRNNNVIQNTLEDNDGFGIKVTREPQGTICGNTLTNNRSGLTNRQTVSNPPCN